MEFTATQKGRGFVYAANDNIYWKSSITTGIKYLVCVNDECKGTAKIEGATFVELSLHNSQGSMSQEIDKLILLAKICKHAAEGSSSRPI